jgi:hypothetical protein
MADLVADTLCDRRLYGLLDLEADRADSEGQ